MGRSKKQKRIMLAVDLGTGNYKCAGLFPDGSIEAIPDADGKFGTPSVIAFQEGDPLKAIFGKAAVNYQKIHPEWAVDTNKRLRGKGDIVALVDASGKMWTSGELETMFLQNMLEQAKIFLGPDILIDGVLATVPACFNQAEREATILILERAGCHSLGTLNEPTGAVIHFCQEKVESGIAVVMDCGCGTSDVTVIKILKKNTFQVLSTRGRQDLAGTELSMALMRHCAQIMSERGVKCEPERNRREYALLREQCEDAKHTLSTLESAQLSWYWEGQLFDTQIERSQFEALIVPVVSGIRELILESLSMANMKPDALDYVVPVGGTCRTPAILALLEEMFGPGKIRRDCDVDRAVVLGAAASIGMKVKECIAQGDYVLEDIVPEYTLPVNETKEIFGRPFGLVAKSEATGKDEFVVLLPEDTTLPCSASKRFGIDRPDWTPIGEVTISILEGQTGCGLEQTRVLHAFNLENLPAGPNKNRIEIHFMGDTSAMLSVRAIDTFTGKEVVETVDASSAKKRAS